MQMAVVANGRSRTQVSNSSLPHMTKWTYAHATNTSRLAVLIDISCASMLRSIDWLMDPGPDPFPPWRQANSVQWVSRPKQHTSTDDQLSIVRV